MLYLIIAFVVFILSVIAAGFILGPKELGLTEESGSPYIGRKTKSQEDIVLQRLIITLVCLAVGIFWPLTVLAAGAAIFLLLVMRLTGFLLKKGAKLHKEKEK